MLGHRACSCSGNLGGRSAGLLQRARAGLQGCDHSTQLLPLLLAGDRDVSHLTGSQCLGDLAPRQQGRVERGEQ